jgi:hypothetical protein
MFFLSLHGNKPSEVLKRLQEEQAALKDLQRKYEHELKQVQVRSCCLYYHSIFFKMLAQHEATDLRWRLELCMRKSPPLGN